MQLPLHYTDLFVNRAALCVKNANVGFALEPKLAIKLTPQETKPQWEKE